MIEKHLITGLILAGGQGTRMGRVNKGLQILDGKPMVQHVLERLNDQVGTMLINANQDLARYAEFGVTVCQDITEGFPGPLAGIEAGLRQCDTPFLLSAPCDSPFLPLDLVQRLSEDLLRKQADIAIATTTEQKHGTTYCQRHPVFALMNVSVANQLSQFIVGGGRKVDLWLDQCKTVEVAFPDSHHFLNVNTLHELQQFST